MLRIGSEMIVDVHQPRQAEFFGQIDFVGPGRNGYRSRRPGRRDLAMVHHDHGVANQHALANIEQLSAMNYGCGRQQGGGEAGW